MNTIRTKKLITLSGGRWARIGFSVLLTSLFTVGAQAQTVGEGKADPLRNTNKELRTKVEQGLTEAFGALSVASAVMSPEMLEQALLYPRQSVALDVSFKNIMSVNVPVYDFQTKTAEEGDIFPYGLAQTSGELDDAMTALSGVFEDMLELAQVEKTMQLLAQEIEKTRRRVNALEYVMIPDLERNIKYIAMKLEENERANTTRLMKVKDMVLQDAHHYKS